VLNPIALSWRSCCWDKLDRGDGAMSEDPLALSKISAAPPAETDYEAICAAVMETERGRWFLTEYARRNRHADTNVILSAIGRIEAAIRGEEVSPESSHLRLDLIDMAEIIARTEAEMAAINPEAARAGNRDEPAQRQDSTAAEVLAAAERVLDIVWTLREREVDAELCDALQAAASEIHAAGERQDFTALRAHKAMQVLRHLEGRIHALIDVRGEGPAGKAAANGAVAGEHETAEMDTATASRTEAEPEVREPLGLDLDSLMPAKPPREAEADVEMAASPPVEEANLIDEAAALIGAASETADVSEPAADRPAEPDPAPAMLDSPADLATMDAVAHAPAEPLDVVADPSIIFAAARPPIFVVFQASETIVDEAPLDPPVPPTELPIEADLEAAGAPEVPLQEPEPATEIVEDLTAADAAEPPIEAPIAPIGDFTAEPEPEHVPSEAGQVTAEDAAEAAADAVVEAAAEATTEAETAAPVSAIEAAHPAPAGEEADVAPRAELEIEPVPSDPVTQALVDLDSPPAVDVSAATEDTAIEDEPIGDEPIEDVPIEELPEAPAATLPVEHRAADMAAEPSIEVAAVEAHAPAEVDDLIGQTADNSDVPPPAEACAPATVDDLEFLLEPLPSQAAPGADVIAPEPEVPEESIPAPEVTASAPEPVAPTPALAALLPAPYEDPADLFDVLPEPAAMADEIPAPSRDVAPAAADANAASVDAAIAETAIAEGSAAIPEATFAEPAMASPVAHAELAPDAAAVAAPLSAAQPRLAPRQIQTPRVTPNDPMAAVRALSDDELIALFS
jgi:hypothetical protein